MPAQQLSVGLQWRTRRGISCLYQLDNDDIERTESLAGRGMGPVVELVETLPVGERDAVKARVLDERSYSEIAASLHCSEMVVRKRVSRGLARVRRRLEAES
jgi:RNA polymerase sigma-70 factor (ECF subfamily)